MQVFPSSKGFPEFSSQLRDPVPGEFSFSVIETALPTIRKSKLTTHQSGARNDFGITCEKVKGDIRGECVPDVVEVPPTVVIEQPLFFAL